MVTETFLLYLCIMLSTTLLALLMQKKRRDGNVRFEKGAFFISFLIHWFFLVFTRTGVDHDTYVSIIEDYVEIYFLWGQEPGFNGFCIIMKYLTGDPEKVIFFLKTLTIFLYYQAIWLIRKKAYMLLVMVTFNSKLYFWSYIILGQSLALAMVMVAFGLLINEKKWYWPVIVVLIAYTFHASALVMLPVFIAIELLNRYRIVINEGKIVLYLLISIFVLFNIRILFSFLTSRVAGFQQYATYEETWNTGLGLFNYVFFTYFLIVFIVPIIRSSYKYQTKNIYIVLFFYGFLSAVTAYFVGATRLNYYTYLLYMLLLPCYFHNINLGKVTRDKRIPYNFQKCSWMTYILLTAIVELQSICDPQSLSDLDNYTLFNPFAY